MQHIHRAVFANQALILVNPIGPHMRCICFGTNLSVHVLLSAVVCKEEPMYVVDVSLTNRDKKGIDLWYVIAHMRLSCMYTNFHHRPLYLYKD